MDRFRYGVRFHSENFAERTRLRNAVSSSVLISLLLFLGTFFFYLIGVSPALDGGDAGEFIASSFTLGIAHAPGYPLPQLLGKCASLLIPFATASYRFHVLSAVIGACLTVILFRFLKNFFEEEASWPAFLAALFASTTPLFIEQSRVAEVFGLNALFALSIVWLLKKSFSNRHLLIGAAFLLGLGFGNHHTLIVLSILFLPIFLKAKSQKLFFTSGIFFLLGFSVNLYLPIRAFANPPVNFGDPQTWDRFWAVITRKEFGALSLHPAALPYRDGSVVIQQIFRFLERNVAELGFVGIGLAILGAIIGWRNIAWRWPTVIALLGWWGVGLGFEIYSNLSPTSDIGQWRLERFFLLPLLAAIFLIGVTLHSAWRTPSRFRKIFIGVCAVAIVISMNNFWHRKDFSKNFVFRDFALSALRCAPPATQLVIDRVIFDEPTSSLLVTVLTESKRPDIKFLYRPGTLFDPVYGEDILQRSWSERYQRQQQVESQLLSGATPVRCLAFDKNNTPFRQPALEGLLFRDGVSDRDLMPFLLKRTSADDYPSRLIHIHAPYFFGKAALDRADVGSAKKWFNSAIQASGGMAWLCSNIGGLYAQKELIDDAERMFKQAVRLDPYFFEAQFGLGFVFIRREQWELAQHAFQAAVRVAPSRAEAHYMLGIAFSSAGKREQAIQAWQRYLALEPRGKMADAVRQQLK